MAAVKNLQYLLKLLRTNSELPKEVRSVASIVRGVSTPKTKGVGYFIPHTSHLSVREQLGLSKGAYGSLNKFQKQALEDYAYYQMSGKHRSKFIWNPKEDKYRYGKVVQTLKGEVPGYNHIVSMPGATIRQEFARTPNGVLSFFPNISQSRVGFVPKGYNFGELRATPEGNGFQKSIVLTSPRVDFIDSMVEVTPEQVAKLPNRIPKEDMKRFWGIMEQTTKPGTYLSGDAGRMPLGGFMIKAKTPSEASKILLADAADLSPLSTRTGLSPDSYKAIIKQGLRPEHRLRFSRNGFTKLNSSAVDNKALYDQWRAASTPEQKAQFVENWNNQIYPGTASINDKGVVQFLQPFAFYMRKGGPLFNIKK